ncbi:hypothetical protein EZS27_011136 [termite gut metagenome]|uniref:Protein kinase domain-containing protein n=1 Tax=termite gut metagenome TaxID=433724 RepID=A0A5J4S6J0_9ZZZZ
MPNKSDIINAVKNSDIFLKIPELKGATVKLKPDGSPFFYTGGFNMVFQLTEKSQEWAFRVWHTNINHLKDRFQKISQYLSKQKLPYFADFIYDESGLLVNGELADTIRMEWLDGLLLKDFIEKNLNNKGILLKLAEDFLTMCKDLHNHKISHGDLQHGNIIIDGENKIRLIDYDSVCVPDIEEQEEYVTGLKGYQHPSRINSKNKTSLNADYFSELIIYLSIVAIAENPKLWEDFQVKDSEFLLCGEDDFTDFSQSKIYNDLSHNASQEIKDLLNIVVEYLSTPSYRDLEPFFTYLIPPKIIQFSMDKEVIIRGQKVTLLWNVNKALEIEIDNGIGKVNHKDKKEIYPNQNPIYKLTARNSYGISEQEIVLRIFPTPIIESLKVPMPDFESKINLNSINITSPKIDVSINLPDFNLNLPQFTASSVDLQKIRPKYKPKVSIFNFSKIYEYIRKREL